MILSITSPVGHPTEVLPPKDIAILVSEEALWLAWKACGGPVGMGVFQTRLGG